jgi:hypothetical protein
MKASLVTILCLFFVIPAQAQETWERCMDQGDFNFNADTFLKSYRMSKSGCVMNFVEVSSNGKRFQVNLCDANIHIGEYESPHSESLTRHYAGSSGCPAPLFGADFHVSKKGGVEFGIAKKQVMDIFAAVKKVFGPNVKVEDAEKISNPTPNSEIKVACARLLLDEYLDRCSAFEAPAEKIQPAAGKEPQIPGVRPQIIKK